MTFWAHVLTEAILTPNVKIEGRFDIVYDFSIIFEYNHLQIINIIMQIVPLHLFHPFHI